MTTTATFERYPHHHYVCRRHPVFRELG